MISSVNERGVKWNKSADLAMNKTKKRCVTPDINIIHFMQTSLLMELTMTHLMMMWIRPNRGVLNPWQLGTVGRVRHAVHFFWQLIKCKKWELIAVSEMIEREREGEFGRSVQYEAGASKSCDTIDAFWEINFIRRFLLKSDWKRNKSKVAWYNSDICLPCIRGIRTKDYFLRHGNLSIWAQHKTWFSSPWSGNSYARYRNFLCTFCLLDHLPSVVGEVKNLNPIPFSGAIN